MLFRSAPGTILVVDVAGLTGDQQSLVTTENGPDGAPILVVRDGPRAFRALSMPCTHEGCPLNPPARGTISCPCHGSQFDLSGKVLKGPAVYPLGQYATRFDRETNRLTVRFGA